MHSVMTALLVLGLIAESAILYHVFSYPTCKEQELTDHASPSGGMKAQLVTEDCITSWISSNVYRHVIIVYAENKRQKISSFDVKKNQGGNVHIKWKSDDQIEIQMNNIYELEYQRLVVDGLKISYRHEYQAAE